MDNIKYEEQAGYHHRKLNGLRKTMGHLENTNMAFRATKSLWGLPEIINVIRGWSETWFFFQEIFNYSGHPGCAREHQCIIIITTGSSQYQVFLRFSRRPSGKALGIRRKQVVLRSSNVCWKPPWHIHENQEMNMKSSVIHRSQDAVRKTRAHSVISEGMYTQKNNHGHTCTLVLRKSQKVMENIHRDLSTPRCAQEIRKTSCSLECTKDNRGTNIRSWHSQASLDSQDHRNTIRTMMICWGHKRFRNSIPCGDQRSHQNSQIEPHHQVSFNPTDAL